MFRSFTVLLLSSILILTSLAPSYLTMMDVNTEKMELIDFTEEESKPKTEKNSEDTKLIVMSLLGFKSFYYLSNTGLFNFYQENISTPTSKIDLPPPEFIA